MLAGNSQGNITAVSRNSPEDFRRFLECSLDPAERHGLVLSLRAGGLCPLFIHSLVLGSLIVQDHDPLGEGRRFE